MSAELIDVANRLAAKGRGILAADESTGTIGKRLEKAGLVNDEETRRRWRELFLTARLGDHVSGVILFKETLYQSASDGRPFVECLGAQGILAGIKVDEGLEVIEGTDGETHTKGLDTLEQRCKEYRRQGARFAKWRAALRVTDTCPSDPVIEANAVELASYAVICQRCGLVPIVEPEILIDGPHDAERFAAVSERVISEVVTELWKQGVLLEGCLLKPQMVVPGTDFPGPRLQPEEVAALTLRVMRRAVPPAVPGIMFLSGGMSEVEATTNLNALNVAAARQDRGACACGSELAWR